MSRVTCVEVPEEATHLAPGVLAAELSSSRPGMTLRALRSCPQHRHTLTCRDKIPGLVVETCQFQLRFCKTSLFLLSKVVDRGDQES